MGGAEERMEGRENKQEEDYGIRGVTNRERG